jgi:hypothetical protein
VPLAGLEPARCFHHLILSQARLPIPPQGLVRDHSREVRGVNGPIPLPPSHRYMGRGSAGTHRVDRVVWKGIHASGELGLLPPPFTGEGWGGGVLARMCLVACPLPIPPAEVGYIQLWPIKSGRTRVNPSSVQAGEGTHRARSLMLLQPRTNTLQGCAATA